MCLSLPRSLSYTRVSLQINPNSPRLNDVARRGARAAASLYTFSKGTCSEPRSVSLNYEIATPGRIIAVVSFFGAAKLNSKAICCVVVYALTLDVRCVYVYKYTSVADFSKETHDEDSRGLGLFRISATWLTVYTHYTYRYTHFYAYDRNLYFYSR